MRRRAMNCLVWISGIFLAAYCYDGIPDSNDKGHLYLKGEEKFVFVRHAPESYLIKSSGTRVAMMGLYAEDVTYCISTFQFSLQFKEGSYTINGPTPDKKVDVTLHDNRNSPFTQRSDIGTEQSSFSGLALDPALKEYKLSVSTKPDSLCDLWLRLNKEVTVTVEPLYTSYQSADNALYFSDSDTLPDAFSWSENMLNIDIMKRNNMKNTFYKGSGRPIPTLKISSDSCIGVIMFTELNTHCKIITEKTQDGYVFTIGSQKETIKNRPRQGYITFTMTDVYFHMRAPLAIRHLGTCNFGPSFVNDEEFSLKTWYEKPAASVCTAWPIAFVNNAALRRPPASITATTTTTTTVIPEVESEPDEATTEVVASANTNIIIIVGVLSGCAVIAVVAGVGIFIFIKCRNKRRKKRQAPPVAPTISVSQDREPSIDQREPSVEQKAPSVEQKVPSVQQKAPSVEKKERSVEKKERSVEQKEPSFDPTQVETTSTTQPSNVAPVQEVFVIEERGPEVKPVGGLDPKKQEKLAAALYRIKTDKAFAPLKSVEEKKKSVEEKKKSVEEKKSKTKSTEYSGTPPLVDDTPDADGVTTDYHYMEPDTLRPVGQISNGNPQFAKRKEKQDAWYDFWECAGPLLNTSHHVFVDIFPNRRCQMDDFIFTLRDLCAQPEEVFRTLANRVLEPGTVVPPLDLQNRLCIRIFVMEHDPCMLEIHFTNPLSVRTLAVLAPEITKCGLCRKTLDSMVQGQIFNAVSYDSWQEICCRVKRVPVDHHYFVSVLDPVNPTTVHTIMFLRGAGDPASVKPCRRKCKLRPELYHPNGFYLTANTKHKRKTPISYDIPVGIPEDTMLKTDVTQPSE